MTEEIKIINDMIAQAVIHGADAGGSYDQNEEGLMRAITNWLIFKGLDGKYMAEYKYVCILEGECRGGWNIIQICPKGGVE